MEDKIREARVTLGTKTYVLRTALSAAQFNEIAAFSQKLFASLDPKADQEKRLMLGWMYMAYKLQQVEEKLTTSLKKSEAMTVSQAEKETKKGAAE